MELAGLLASKVGADAGETVMTTAEQLREQGIERGIEQGLEKGLEQGLEQGRRDVLLRQIHLRFGALAEEYVLRVKSADSKRLDALTERVLTATSVGDLFR
jgi:flagellar biosynthesis/type III secretory pathway protein FliH